MLKVVIFILILILKINYSFSQDEILLSYLNKEYAKCISLCKEKLKEAEKDFYYYMLGLSYLQTGFLEEAQNVFRKLLKKFPESIFKEEAILGIGDAYLYKEEFTKALKIYKKLLRFKKDYAPLHLRIAKTLLKLGDWQKAHEHLVYIISEFPDTYFAKVAKELIEDGLYFKVQVGAFKYKENALNLCKELRKKGFKPYIVKKITPQGVIYRVRIGKEKERKIAEKLKSQLLDLGFPATIYP